MMQSQRVSSADQTARLPKCMSGGVNVLLLGEKNVVGTCGDRIDISDDAAVRGGRGYSAAQWDGSEGAASLLIACQQLTSSAKGVCLVRPSLMMVAMRPLAPQKQQQQPCSQKAMMH
jgi:hypothetical protein